MPSDNAGTSRREVLKGALAASMGAMVLPADTHSSAQGAPNASGGEADRPIAAENSLQGTRDWQLTRVRLDKSGGYRSPAIEGFCSKQSVEAGETIEFFVSTELATSFQIEVFRMGYYGGAEIGRAHV